MKRIAFILGSLLITALLLTQATSAAPEAPSYSGCGGVANPPASNSAYDQQVVELTNQKRLENGNLPPYKRVDSLDQAARYMSIDMAQDDYWPAPPLVNHGTYDRVAGNLVYQCAWDTRVHTYYNSPRAENIAVGYSTPENVIAGWMSSSGHKANILSTSSCEIGVGYFEGSGSYYRYWTQDFGCRSGVYPLVINREQALTYNPDVSIWIYGDWNEMRVRNDGEDWPASWQTFANQFDWTLTDSSGQRSVEAQVRNASTTVSTSDTILYINLAEFTEKTYLPVVLR
jgi:uncharacterized protein YkwD